MKYVLRRYDKDPKLPWLFVGYTEQVTSVCYEMDGKRAATLFLRSRNSRDRALKLGWKDETNRYNAIMQEKEKAEAVIETFVSAPPKRKRKK